MLTGIISDNAKIRICINSGILVTIFSIYAIFAPSYYTARASYAFSTTSWTINQSCYQKRDANKDLEALLLENKSSKVYTIYGLKGIGKSSFLKIFANDNPGVFYYEIGLGDLDQNNPFEGFLGKIFSRTNSFNPVLFLFELQSKV